MNSVTNYDGRPLMVKTSNALFNLKSTLKFSLDNLEELEHEIRELSMESEFNKSQFKAHSEQCKFKNCANSQTLQKTLAQKDSILESVKSTLQKIYETKELSFLSDLFKLFSLESTVEKPVLNEKINYDKVKENEVEVSTPLQEDVSMKDESVSEIEGTPTGRTSPIIQSKVKNGLDIREKKKCPAYWQTPPKKSAKTKNMTPNRKSSGRFQQTRLNLQKLKPSFTVDLTCSPEFSSGLHSMKTDGNVDIKPTIKKEYMENEDTILPSPTSRLSVTEISVKQSPIKKKSLKLKRESDENENKIPTIKQENINEISHNITDIENSINIMNHLHHRFKKPAIKPEKDPDYTTCSQNDSISLLKRDNKLESDIADKNIETLEQCNTKEPLAENINITNCELESSMSLLRQEVISKPNKLTLNKTDRKADKVEAVYKEPTIRKRAEKRALPGWSCDECKNFYDELYKDDPEMLAKLMQECSKHRGKHNPARPKTPEGFWNPRWDVPEDTAEFNLRNNAV